VIEVADTSLKDDLTDAASRYARVGVREYWVVDVNTPCIYVHRDPVKGEYPPPQKIGVDTPLAARLIPDVSIRLADIS
jgi:Uma2 family endonuclease